MPSRFVRLLGVNQSPDTKNVTGTNFIDIGWAYDARAGTAHLDECTEDNIGKGASGPGRAKHEPHLRL
jgi:N-acetyl-gamma-glutamyl-phosphate reductase